MPYRVFDINGIGNVTVYKRKGNRTIRLTVNGEGSVRVTMPTWAPYQAGVAFVMSRRSWITAQSHKVPDKQLVDGLPIGKAHHLSFRASPDAKDITSSVRGTIITVTYPSDQDIGSSAVQTVAHAACLRALRVQATELLGRRLQQLAPLHDLSYRSLRIKRMKTRWGSCDQHTNIVLNLFLIQLPWEYIDYVILHELAHTKVLHHGPLFWSTLEGLLPKARLLKKAMKTYQPTLFIAE